MGKKKFSLKNIENGDVAKTVAGTSIGVVTPFLLREYVDGYISPEGVWPGVIPAQWGKISVLGSIGIGITCLVGGVVSKSLRLFLLPLGIASTSVGVMMGLFPTPPSAAVRLAQKAPAGRGIPGQNQNLQLRSAQPNVNVSLRAAGSNPAGRVNVSNNPGSFAQKNPELRLQELQKEALDLETQKEIKKLELENSFKKSQPASAIPLRT